MHRLACAFFLSSLTLNLSGQQAQEPESNTVRVQARVVEQRYCRENPRVYSILLKIEMGIENPSRTPVHVLWPMVPVGGKVASGVGDAEAGRFLYVQTQSRYFVLPMVPTRFERLKIEPGKKVSKRIGYYLFARHDPTFSQSKSVSAGTYALVLVLGPDEEPPAEMKDANTLMLITTEPFVVEVPEHPKLDSCEAGAKPH